jgi:predicted DNA-binding transcriptional regulator AlpA
MGDVIPKNHFHDKLASVLAKHIEGDDDVVVRTPAAASMLGMSVQWMESGRHYGYGPAFIHIGPRAVGYRLGDLRKYLASRTTHRCTKEYTSRKSKKRGAA